MEKLIFFSDYAAVLVKFYFSNKASMCSFLSERFRLKWKMTKNKRFE